MQYFAVIDDIVQSQVFLFNCISIYSIFGVDKDETCLLSVHTHYLLKPHVGAAKRKNERHMRDKYEGRPHKWSKGLAWLQRPNYGLVSPQPSIALNRKSALNLSVYIILLLLQSLKNNSR